MIRFSAPGKVHLLGEHAVVYGKPALLATVNLRVTVTVIPADVPIISGSRSIGAGIQLANPAKWIPAFAGMTEKLQTIIESIVKKHLNIKAIPCYRLIISSQLPIGCGLGSSAAISAAYIAALLTYLKVKWDKTLVNELAYQAEKVFHGNPSGGDNSTVVYGGLVWFRKETPDLKIIHPLPFTISPKLAKNFILINTGIPKETTKQMVEIVKSKVKLPFGGPKLKVKKIFDDQEQLVKELLVALKDGREKKLIQIIKAGEKNLEAIGAVSSYVKSIIRKIEKAGGAAKICGAGGQSGSTGVLLCYHPKPAVVGSIAKSYHLSYFKLALGVEGLRQESL